MQLRTGAATVAAAAAAEIVGGALAWQVSVHAGMCV